MLHLSRKDLEYVLHTVKKYGQDSLSYLTLEKGNKYFISQSYEGFIAYIIVGKIAVCLGNPICAQDNLRKLTNEFKKFCQENKLKICFSSVHGEIVKILEQDGYCLAKYGEEAILDLNTYTTAGSKKVKLRQKLRRAEKFGINTIEYQPQKCRDFVLEQKIIQVSEEWYADKNGKLTFTLGEINLEQPLERRYFLAMDEDRDVQAVLVFSPFQCGAGYFLDVMRKRKNTVPGVMEKAIIDSAWQMKEEGVQCLSLGLAPLAGIEKKEKMNLLEKCFYFTYKHLNQNYGFKSLYDYKKKFSPSRWEERYVVHESTLSCFKVAWAMLKARNVDIWGNNFILVAWKAGINSLQTAIKQMFSKYSDNIKA